MSTASHKSLRILMVLENCSYPQDVRVRSEAETLASAGYPISVLCPRAPGQPWHEELHGVRLFRFPEIKASRGVMAYLVEFGYATLLLTLMVLWRWLRDGFDVLHIHNPPDTLFVAALGPKLAGKRVIFDHHDLAAELYEAKQQTPNPQLTRLLHTFEHISCRVANYVITANDSYRRIDINRNHVNPDRACVVRNGPNLTEFPTSLLHLRSESEQPVLIGYIGYIARQDGVDQLLYALHHLQEDLHYHNWQCKIVGPADELDVLEALLAELKLTESVEFMGGYPHLQAVELLARVDIGIAPEPMNELNNNSTMIKVMEYMALGKPVVAYDLAEHRITAGDAALYARPNDPQDMARQIAKLLDHPELRTQLGDLGRQRIEQELSWPHSAEKLLRCYDKVAARR